MKQSKRKAKVIPISTKVKLKPGQVRISKVYARAEVKQDGTNGFAFNLEYNYDGNTGTKGYEFESREGAKKGRALMIKGMKNDGIKVFC